MRQLLTISRTKRPIANDRFRDTLWQLAAQLDEHVGDDLLWQLAQVGLELLWLPFRVKQPITRVVIHRRAASCIQESCCLFSRNWWMVICRSRPYSSVWLVRVLWLSGMLQRASDSEIIEFIRGNSKWQIRRVHRMIRYMTKTMSQAQIRAQI